MVDEQALVPTQILPTLDSSYGQLIDKLEKYEDYLSFYTQLDEATTAMSWVKADMLLQMVMNLGEGSLAQLSQDLKQPKSTVVNYVRTARAFPPEKRQPIVPFSTHFHASFADSYSEKEAKFDGELRFEIIEKAADENTSVRDVIHNIKEARILAVQGDEELHKMALDAEEKAHEIMRNVASLKDDARKGNKEAHALILEIYNQVKPLWQKRLPQSMSPSQP